MSAPTPQPITDWLEKLGLGQYAQQFVEHEITPSILPDLTDADLKELGIAALGHRRLLLRAIAELEGFDKRAPTHTTAALAPVTPQQGDTAERRQVTVLFSDLVGSTALSARMDPEDLREVISPYQKCVAQVVQRFDGFVAKYMGDGVLVYFGYPQAHEDDAERAVRAGLELIQAVGGLKSNAPLQTRLGIATGLVVVGDLVGTGEAQERGIVGETPNIAARLQGIAEPNMVVIAESTRRLLGNLFDLEDLGAKDLKGIAEPMRTWAALRPSAAESRFEALHATGMTALVGREEELELLLRRWSKAKTGEGQVVLLSGEAGIGKSRLTVALLERLGDEPHTRLRYFCSPQHTDSALYPAIAQLERAAGLRRDDTGEQRLEKLEAVLLRATNEIGEIAPLLADLLSIPTDSRYPAVELTPQKRKQKTLQALVAQVEGLSRREPLLMVFEDVHWSDPTTRESLDLLVDRVSTLRTLVIITFRPEFTPPWIGRPHVTLVSLSRLSRRQRAAMITGVTGGKALPKEIVDQIIERTDGVPLFIEELTKSVVESGLVTRAGDHYSVAGPTTALAIPSTLHASLLARLDRLAPTREVAQIGAALGRSFSHEVICAVAQMPQQRVDDALKQLVNAELIFRRGTPPEAEYTFKHALVQDAAYSTLLRSRRQQIHARVASILQNNFPEVMAAQPELLAHHCGEAGLNEKAVAFWLKAGQQAAARSSMMEAVAQLTKGLDLLAALPDSTSRQQQELELRVALGPPLIATRGYASPQVGEVFAKASELAEQLGRRDYLGPITAGLYNFHLVRAEWKEAMALAEQMKTLGKAQDNLSTLLLGKQEHGTCCFFRGEFAAARSMFEQCHALREPAHRASVRAWTVQDPYTAMLSYLSNTLALQGYIDQGRALSKEAVTEAQELRHAFRLVHAQVYAALFERTLRAAHELYGYANNVAALCDTHGFPQWAAWGFMFQGNALTALGHARDGFELITKGLAIFRGTGAILAEPTAITILAEGYRALGRPREGLSCLREAQQKIDRTEERVNEADILRLRGELLLDMGDIAMAEQSYRQAIAIAAQQCAKLYELRAATCLSRLWRDQGKPQQAHQLLAPVYGWFTEGFDTLDLEHAKALLEELAV